MLELGTGWAPAVADDAAELKLMQEQERISTDDRTYWIGGLAYDQVQNESNFFKNPFLRPLIPLVWTSGDIFLDFKARVASFICICM